MRTKRALLRFAALAALAFVALQASFALRVASMALLDPQSTTFQRSEAWRLAVERGTGAGWSQRWAPLERISRHLQRAVVASEDSTFVDHRGIDWDAVEHAWQRNQRAVAKPLPPGRTPKVIGGSTITQQLAKNLLLSGERTALRKAQEAAITLMLEGLLPKRRILEIYLNSVEWGEGVFGAEAASRHYFRVDAARLSPEQAARLAVMLPAPKRFERLRSSPYLAGRSATIVARMGAVELP